MTRDDHVVGHARTFAALTLVSRVLGLARDAILARLFGVTGLGTAFGIAFQFPNTFRRLFGEGALSAAFIPEYARLLRQDHALADRFASLVVALTIAVLGAATVILEAVIIAVVASIDLPDHGRRALILLALMLPYMPMVCATAILGGMLQTHGRFAAQAGAPIILNLCMIAAALAGARVLRLNAESTALIVAGSVTVAGVLQIAWCLRDLRGLTTWSRMVEGVAAPARTMFRRLGPVLVGLGAVQVATLVESWLIVAWPIYQGPTILGNPYPLDEGAGAALTNAQRLYQFPLGVFGIALATAAFPTLARLADEKDRFAQTLRKSLRLSLFIGLPATVGLAWVARDLTAVIYLGGRVGHADAERIARCLVMYALLVGAYSLTHVLTRAFYALGDTRTPMKVSIATVALGLALSLALMWPMREAGLALAASIAAAVQLAFLVRLAGRRMNDAADPLFDRAVRASAARIAAGAALMLAALAGARLAWPAPAAPTYWDHGLRLVGDASLGVLVYFAYGRAFCRDEVSWLLARRERTPSAGASR